MTSERASGLPAPLTAVVTARRVPEEHPARRVTMN
jgi:hypothetical protein